MGIILLIALAIFGYYKYTERPQYVDNKEFNHKNSSPSTPIDIYFFHVDWCPHCKKAEPVWIEIENSMPKVNGRTIRYHKINCEKAEENGPQMADKYNVTSYPTIKMVKDKQTIEYDAKPEVETLKQFIRTAA